MRYINTNTEFRQYSSPGNNNIPTNRNTLISICIQNLGGVDIRVNNTWTVQPGDSFVNSQPSGYVDTTSYSVQIDPADANALVNVSTTNIA